MKINDDLIGTVKNSTKWNNLERDTITVNDADTWIPVLNGEKMQHTTKASIFTTGANVYSDTSATMLSNYFSTVDINRIVKTGKVVQFAFRGLVANTIPGNTSCMSGLPPAYIGSNNAITFNISDDRYPTVVTPYWGFTDGSGNLKTSGISVGKWVHINITYVMV